MGFFFIKNFKVISVNLNYGNVNCTSGKQSVAKCCKVGFKSREDIFWKKEQPYNPEFAEKILYGDKDFKEGNFTKADLENLWK